MCDRTGSEPPFARERVCMVRYSASEDGEHACDSISGPMNLARLKDELRRLAGSNDIRAIEHGAILGDTVARPGIG